MGDETQPALAVHLFGGFFGGITGAAYGVILWVIAFYVTKASHPAIIVWSAVVFGVIAIFFENFILEAFLGLVYFFWGLFSGFAGNDALEQDPDNHLRAFFWVGFGTSIVIILWWFY